MNLSTTKVKERMESLCTFVDDGDDDSAARDLRDNYKVAIKRNRLNKNFTCIMLRHLREIVVLKHMNHDNVSVYLVVYC